MPYNFANDSFTQRNFVADFLQAKCRLAFLRPPLGDLGATTIILGSLERAFLLALIFSLDVTVEALKANIGWKSVISLQRGPVDTEFEVEGVAPTNHSYSQRTRLNYLSYGIKICTYLFSVLSQFTRVTDGQTERLKDRNLIAIPLLHVM